MKTITRILGVALTVAMFIFLDACKGEKGDVGPAGTAGPTGVAGPTGTTGATGTTGKDGNANAIQINFGPVTYIGTSGELFFNLTSMTEAQINNSSYFMYVRNPSTAASSISQWYSLPGWTAFNEYRITINTNPSGIAYPRLYLARMNSSSSNEAWGAAKIIFIASNDIRNGRKAAVDFSDYEAVKKFYNLPD